MLKMIFNKREKIILSATVGVVIFALGLNFLIEPVLSRYRSLNKEIDIVQTRFKRYLLLLSQKEYIQNKYNEFSASLKRPGSGEATSVSALSQIENFGKVANIRIIDIRPQNPQNIDLYREIPVELRTEGDMEGYLRFIYDIENSLLLLRIKRFQLNARPNTQVLEGSFSLSQLSLD